MSTKDALRKTLAQWADSLGLDATTQRLINLANWDLYCGPYAANTDPPADADGNENEWAGYPGFVRACELMKEAISDVPRTLYVDVDAGYWSDAEPDQYEDCPDCNGAGTKPSDTIDEPDVDCDYCKGDGRVEAFLEGWYEVEYRDLVSAIVGKELSEYVR